MTLHTDPSIQAMLAAQSSRQMTEIAIHTRSILESMLSGARGTSETRGSCMYAAYLLASMLNQFKGCDHALVRGGDGEGDGGYFSADQVGHGHYWVEATVGPDTYVIDITADQFGGPAIMIATLAESRQRYRAGEQATIDDHVADFAASLEACAAPSAS